jgi:hypothetical protein
MWIVQVAPYIIEILLFTYSYFSVRASTRCRAKKRSFVIFLSYSSSDVCRMCHILLAGLSDALVWKGWKYCSESKMQSDPATRHGGAWDERRYSSYSFLTSALDGGEWSASRPGRAIPPGKGPPIPIVQEAGWALEPVWTQRQEEKSSASVRDRTSVVQSVVRHYTIWATVHCSIETKMSAW